MRKILNRVALLTTVAASAMMVGGRADAAGVPAEGLRTAIDSLALIENVQEVFIYNGLRYCWYDFGWNGPGWYVCSYGPWVRGRWWGGARGWRGWWWGRWGRRPPGWGMGGMWGGGMMGGGMMGGPGGGGMMGGGGPMGGGPMGGGPMGGGGMGGGGMGGGGGGMMSDIRAKHDIALLGRLDNGLGFYRFSYHGSDQAYVGVMAQEVETVMPEAVVHGAPDGYLRVDYDKLGVCMQTWEEWLANPATTLH